MAFINIDKNELKDLVEILEDSSLAEIKLADGDAKITLSKATSGAVVAPVAAAAPVAMPAAAAAAPVVAAEVNNEDHPGAIKSPMVGNVYLKPSPDADNFVKVGDSVSAGDTLLIVEAMKVMNPIKAEKSGVVKEICVSDAQPVEFEQVLAIIE
ncbi:MAG: acetyl-CoA carboxylase biotin carboxyl carrier protein [Alphaproteobacteria bacterium]|jgi:acetyl-CoA carboxylase biotin carboxyl carrier protein|nr:acetyl-CoA carboxylase biotin carboxyl carrier protein [Alphaproteobacteria bacterium]